MTNYLSYTFSDTDEFVSTFDELPLWSAPFGILLLKHLKFRRNLQVIDIGCGTGFPLMELAERLGASCHVYGVDPWANSTRRAGQKIKNYQLSNVTIIECPAEKMPIGDATIDLIVSNLGSNNFENPGLVLNECRRVLKPDGRMAMTTNLNDHWKEFYELFYVTLQRINKPHLITSIKAGEAHRSTMDGVSTLFNDSGFKVTRQFEEQFEMKFADGSAFLNHHFVKLGWLTTWLGILPHNEWQEVFAALEGDLNEHARTNDGLALTVPMAFIEGEVIK